MATAGVRSDRAPVAFPSRGSPPPSGSTIRKAAPMPATITRRGRSRPTPRKRPSSIWTTFGGTPDDQRKRIATQAVPLVSEGRGTPLRGRMGGRLLVTLRPRPLTQAEEVAMSPIQIPTEWDDNGILLFEEFCSFIRTPQRTVRDWKRRGIGPRWWRFNGNGRLYTTVAELRRFLTTERDQRPALAPVTRRD